MVGSSSSLEKTVAAIIETPLLLVASDFDGTLAAFVNDPAMAKLHSVAAAALQRLKDLSHTEVCIISGRALGDLRERFENTPGLRLIGSHGSEFDSKEPLILTPEQRQHLELGRSIMEEFCRSDPGSSIESKPYGLVWHYRRVGKRATNRAQSLLKRLGILNNCLVREGAFIVELLVVNSDKGTALDKVVQDLRPTAVLFLGDDLTDEDVFRRFSDRAITVKIGQGETSANFRLESEVDASELLSRISDARVGWLNSYPKVAIRDLAIVSDLRTSAIFDDHGSIVWMCAPRLDSAPIFGSLVGGPGAGYFSITSSGTALRNYRQDSMVIETRWDSLLCTDHMVCNGGRAFQRAGRSDLVRTIEGDGDVQIVFAPRLDFGRIATRLTPIANGLKIEGGTQPLILRAAGVEWKVTREGRHDVARANLTLKSDKIGLELLIGASTSNIPSMIDTRDETDRFWSLWLNTLKFPVEFEQLCRRSALVLRALTYGPSGAIAAAATTSLPESLGGERNWDYRFAWPRDGALAASALARLGATGPAIRFLDWMLGILEDDPEDGFINPVYTLSGRHISGEATVTEAIGYRNSRPIRMGNLAAQQLQLDVVAPIVELMALLSHRGANLTTEHLEFTERMVREVATRWRDTDNGIWEIRDEQRNWVHSKLMCWFTVVSAIDIACSLGFDRPEWPKLADEIRMDIESNGFSPELDSYTAAYGFVEADAALLWIILSGFHPPDHPRSLGTLRFIERNLFEKDAVLRYRFADGLSGKEGSFHICHAWFIEALAMRGEYDRAKEQFRILCQRCNSLGLLSEQWDTESQQALGNFPQAYSHLSIINVALRLSPLDRSR